MNLSRHELEDKVEHFYATHETKGNKRLNICLEKMKSEGVVSEEAYVDPHVEVSISCENILLLTFFQSLTVACPFRPPKGIE